MKIENGLKGFMAVGLTLMLASALTPVAWANSAPVEESADEEDASAGIIGTMVNDFGSKIQNIDNYDADTLSALAAAATTEVTPGWNQLGTCEWRVEGKKMVLRPLGGGTVGELPDSTDGDGAYEEYWDAVGRVQVEELEIQGKIMVNGKTSLSHSTLGPSSYSLVKVEGLSSLDTSKATSMDSMFYGCFGLTSLDLS